MTSNDSDDKEPEVNNTPSQNKVTHPKAAPTSVPQYIKSISNFSKIKGHDYCPTSYSSAAKRYVEGYNGYYNNTGRLHLDSSKMKVRKADLLMSELSLYIDNGSAFYISSPNLDVTLFIKGQNTLSSKNSVTLNNNSGMNEDNMNYNACSTLRLMGVDGKTSDILSLFSDYRTCMGGRIVINNCTLDLSHAALTSYANICIERGAKVVFPNGSAISLSSELDSDIYFSCDLEKQEVRVFRTNEKKKIDTEIFLSTGETVHLDGKSGEISFKMPSPGVTLSMENDFCSLNCLVNGTEIPPMISNGSYTFYLPKGSDLTSLELSCTLGSGYTLKVNDRTINSSCKFTASASDKGELEAIFTDPSGKTQVQKYRFVCSSANVLYLQIDESKGSINAMNHDIAHNTYCYGSLAYISENRSQSFESYFSLKGRGNATWEDEKKGYAIKLYTSDAYDKKLKVDIEGMGSSASWSLVANHRDRTLIRNALAYTLTKKLGMDYCVDYVFTDLYMNGQYLGLYMLCEKIETGNGKVEIKEATADNLEGGYLLEFENHADSNQLRLRASRQAITINAPDDLESYRAIMNLLNEADAALQNANGYNSSTGKYWYDYIDIDSFAILWMVREYTLDYDANVNFRFYYDPNDGKFHGGPAWDFDNSMARAAGIYASPNSLLIPNGNRNNKCWLTRLVKFDKFKNALFELYDKNSYLFDNDNENSIYALAFKYRDELESSITHNFEKWSSQLSYKNWNMPKNYTYEGHFSILTDFLKQRNDFWNEYMLSLKS